MRLTVGPLPASVYWRRRAIVLGGALLALFLVAQACIAASASPGGDSTGTPSPDPTPTLSSPGPQSPTGQPAEQPERGDTPGDLPPVDGEVCTDGEILVTAIAETTEFTPGEQVRFAIRIRNDSDRTCRRDIGGDLRELRLLAGTGADKVWSSQDCGGPTGTNDAALQPAHEEEYFLVWNGRSSESCEGGDPAGPVVNPGQYQLFARLGGVHSEPVELTIR